MRSLEEIVKLLKIKTKSKDLKKVLYDKYIKNKVNYNILYLYPELILLFKKSNKINLNKINWSYISSYQKLSESFIREFQDKVEWYNISKYQKLSEDFIREFCNDVYWSNISINQKLTEEFIKEFQDKLDWSYISSYQKLSESFIKEFQDKVNWHCISRYQKLSENLIREFKDKVYWSGISAYQKLSESFIREFKNEVEWFYISSNQNLSEEFIRENKYNVYWTSISIYQKLSDEFIKEFNLVISDDNWFYKSSDFKLEQIKLTGLYEIEGDYVIGFKGIKSDRHSKYNFQYQYLKDETYECHADHNINNENSFGLSVWNYKNASEYCKELVVKVKIHKDDIAALVHNGNKIRATKITILE